jgi:hypothetical protein
MSSQTVNISVFTTSSEEYKELLNKANNSKYLSKFIGSLLEWEGGAKIYKASVELLVNSKRSLLEKESKDFKGAPIVVSKGVIERYLRIKLKVESYTYPEIKNNTGESKETIIDSFGQHSPEIINIKPPQSLLSTDITKVKRLSLKDVKLLPTELKVEVKKIDTPLQSEDYDFINKDIKHWRSTIVNTLQLLNLIKIRYEEQTKKTWSDKHTKTFETIVNRVI